MAREKLIFNKKTIIIPVEYEVWAQIRKIAYAKETSMNQLVRGLLEKYINKYLQSKSN